MPIPKNVSKEFFIHTVDQFFIQENIIDDGSFIHPPIFEDSVNDTQFSFDSFNDIQFSFDSFNDIQFSFDEQDFFYESFEPFIDDELVYYSFDTQSCMEPEFYSRHNIIIIDSQGFSDNQSYNGLLTSFIKLQKHSLCAKEKCKNQTKWQSDYNAINKNQSKQKYFKCTEHECYLFHTKVE